MSPELIMAAAQAVNQKMQSNMTAGLGLWQLWNANKMNKGFERPVMEIPQSIENAEAMARMMAANPYLPNQRQMEQALDTSYAQGAANIGTSAGSSSEALSALTQLQGSRMTAQNDLNSQAALTQRNNQLNYLNFLQNKAPYEQQVWDYNINQPYMNKAAAIQAMRGAGMENFFSGVKGSIAGSTQGGAAMFGEAYKSQEFEKLKQENAQLKARINTPTTTANQNTSMLGSLNAQSIAAAASGTMPSGYNYLGETMTETPSANASWWELINE